MKKIISLLSLLVLIVSCEQDLFDVPRDANGNVVFHGISSTTTTGVSTLDAQFSVTATLPNAKSGDVMNVECLQLQIPPEGGTTKQLLPMAGTQKTATVGADLKATITYTRTEAKLNAIGDYVTVCFNGVTDYAKQKVGLVAAVTTSRPAVTKSATAIVELDVARTTETAYFNVKVSPKSAAYTGTLVAKRKNGKADSWVDVTGCPFANATTFLVPISGADFAVGKDTMYYSFKATVGSITEELLPAAVVVRDPYFYLKKTGVTLTLGGSSAGRNLLTNSAVSATNANAAVAVSGSLILQGGSAFLAAGKTIKFVPSTIAKYDANSTTVTIADFNAGTPATTADPIAGTGVYIFKLVIGPNPADIFYGMIKVTNVVPGVSVTFEYRIGNMYAHLIVIS